MSGRATEGYRKLRPHRWLLRQALVASLAFLVPVFAVLYFLTAPDGPWLTVLITQVVTSLVFAAACVAYVRVAIWVSPKGIIERGFFGGLVTMTTEQIGSIVLVHTYQGGSADTVAQLFVCNHDGDQVIRLRGQFWSLADMRVACEVLDVTVTELSESVTHRELLEQYPGLLYWFERRPILAAAVFSSCVIVGGSLLYLGLASIGVT